MIRIAPFLAFLLLGATFVGWAVTRTFHVGQMALPRAQAAAIAVVVVIVSGLCVAWIALGLRLLVRVLGLARARSLLDRRSVIVVLLSALVLVAGLYLYGRFVERGWVAVREVPLGAGEPVRVVVISDLHVDHAGRPWSRLPELVNAARPDVIFLLGDLLNRPGALPALRRMLRAMRAPHGKLAVRGNWDVWYWHDLPLLDGTGFAWLDASRRELRVRGRTLHLVGLDYRNQRSGRAAERLLAGAPAEEWRLVLYHTPDLVEGVPSADLYLCGHTHGGQVSIPLFGALVTLSRFGKRFERGLYDLGDRWLYVNPGIGVEPAVPLRLGVRPEVTVLLLGEKAARAGSAVRASGL